MDKNKAVELTNKVYRQTLLFPKKEPLRYKIREVADDILSKLVEWEEGFSPNPGRFLNSSPLERKDLIFEIEKDLEVIKAYFEVVKLQNWVSYFDIIKIKEEYEGLEADFKGNLKLAEEKPVFAEPIVLTQSEQPKAVEPEMDERKRKIIKILQERESAQVGDMKKVLPNVSKRTLRRDFDLLIKKGLVQRIGESNNTFYKLN